MKNKTNANEKEKSTGFNTIDVAKKLGYLSIVKLFESQCIYITLRGHSLITDCHHDARKGFKILHCQRSVF